MSKLFLMEALTHFRSNHFWVKSDYEGQVSSVSVGVGLWQKNYPKPVKPVLGNLSKKGVAELYVEALENVAFR